MQFVLFSIITDSVFSKTVGKKPKAMFYDTHTQQEIPKRDWTADMRAYAAKEIQNRPVPHAGVKWKLIAKIFFILAAILIAVGAAALVNELLIKMPRDSDKKAVFMDIPVAGDRYYGNVFGTGYMAGGALQSGWIKIQEMNPQDSVGTILLSRDISAHSGDTRTKDFENFQDEPIRVKFSTEKNSVLFKALDSDLSIESSARSGRYDDFKIPNGTDTP